MASLAWSRRAGRDLQRLDAFLSDRDPEAASRAMQAIRDAVRLLVDFPHAGRPASDLGAECRELPVRFGSSGYVVLYRLRGEAIVIAAVRHMREAGYQP
ncbi:MAG: type II toxin-antitoxin system RelE/ParE family toxin [Myxococcales bacterium]|nr:type II toxin-antitoxin system RelE/ParE family toxin [Myxococcales bacterium]